MFKLLKFFSLCLILFVSGLNIPKISLIVAILLPFISFIFGYLEISKSILNKYFLVILVLFLFTLNHYLHSYLYQFTSLDFSLANFLGINLMFITAIFLNYRKMPFFPFNIIILNLFLFGGGIVWAFLSVFKEIGLNFNVQQIIIEDRRIRSFWSADTVDWGGTVYDMFSTLGLSLMAITFLQVRELLKDITKFSFKVLVRKFILILPFFTLNLIGLYCVIALGGRKPWLILATSLIVTISYDFILKNKFLTVSLITFVLIIQDILIGIILDFLTKFALRTNIGTRFLEKGTESARYELWSKTIIGIWKYPWGGRMIDFPYAIQSPHNLWLDAGYDTGLLSMLLLLTFHLLQIPIVLNLLNSNTFKIIKVFILCTLVAFFMTSMSESVLKLANYFVVSCFFFGSLIRLDYENKKSLYFQSKLANLESKTITK